MENIKTIDHATAVILAGGKSRRMGRDKAFMKAPLSSNNKTMIETVYEKLKLSFENIYISGKENKNYIENIDFIEDLKQLENTLENPLEGPMAGLLPSLSEVSTKWLFLTACDMPFVNNKLIYYMAGKRKDYDVIVPFVKGHVEPLFTFYSKSSFQKLLFYFAKGGRSLSSFIKKEKKLKVLYITEKEIEKIDSGFSAFMDIDNMEDFKRAELKESL